MKFRTKDPLLARADASTILQLPSVWLGVLGCGLSVACAPTSDEDRKFDIAQSHAETDHADDAGAKSGEGSGSSTHGRSTTSPARTNGNTHDTREDESDDETSDVAISDETQTDDTSDGETSNDDNVSGDTSDETSDTSGTTSAGSQNTSGDVSEATTDTGSDELSDQSSDDTTDGSSTDGADDSSDATSEVTDGTKESEDTTDTGSEDTSDTSSDQTSDDGDPGLTSDIADLVWVTGGVGNGPGLFDDARFLAADQAGNVYVAEHEGNGATRVQVFDTEGDFVTQWLTNDTAIVTGMAGTLDGHLFILQGGTVGHYEGPTGEFLGIVPFAGAADAIAVAPDGGLVIVSSDRILRLAPDGSAGEPNTSIGGTLLGNSIFISGASVDGSGNVFVIASFQPAVFKFSSEGSAVDQLGVVGEGPGLLDADPEAIATDRYGRIYVADWDGIEVFEPGGGYAGFIELTGAIFGMAATIDDELFVLERNDGQLYKLKLSE